MENCLLITIDSLRFDHFDADRSPTVAGLADDGVSFRRAYATGPGTSPSFPALLTGTMPLSHGGLGPLSPDRPRIATRMRQAGRATAGFQCNPFLSRHFDYDVGFDAFEDYQHPLMGVATRLFPRGIEIGNPKLERVDEVLHLTDALKKGYQVVKGKPRPYVSAEVVTDDAVEWLESTPDPFFCWAHYMDVHHPCYPPAEYREAHGAGEVTQSEVADWYAALVDDPDALSSANLETLRSLYRAAIEYTDDQVARLVETLENAGRYDDTTVVVTSDHGELFGEYGQYAKPERLYDELLHVPLVVANGPDELDAVADDLVSLLDVPPLIHRALGVEVPDAYEGRRPGVDDPREYVMAEHEVNGDVVVGGRSDRWLYEVDEIRDERRLYDLRDGVERVDPDQIERGGPDGIEQVDPDGGERGDHRRAENDEVRTLRAAVSRRLDDLEVDAAHLEETIDGDVEQRLEDLGYL